MFWRSERLLTVGAGLLPFYLTHVFFRDVVPLILRVSTLLNEAVDGT